MAKKKMFKDGPDGEQLHAGMFLGERRFHSDDGGETWWSGYMFSGVTRQELIDLAVSILRAVPNGKDESLP